jgi:uncharacterized protein (DUF302 family)
MMKTYGRRAGLALACLLFSYEASWSAESGLISKASRHSVTETVARFENAVKSKGWVVFTEIDHAAAARQAGLEMRPRTVILFGNPTAGTAAMQKVATLAIDNPPKALVWQDDEGKSWLTYNSGAYLGEQIYPRHGLALPPERLKDIEQFLAAVSDEATQ